MPTPEKDPHTEIVNELHRLLDLPMDEEIEELLWKLLSDVNEYRRKKGQEKSRGPDRR